MRSQQINYLPAYTNQPAGAALAPIWNCLHLAARSVQRHMWCVPLVRGPDTINVAVQQQQQQQAVHSLMHGRTQTVQSGCCIVD